MVLGAIFFVAAMSMYGSDLFLHGNPIGIRCVFASTGLILGLPIGGLCHQAYSQSKHRISPSFLLNGWVGLLMPICFADLILGVLASMSHLLEGSFSFISYIWGGSHLVMLAAVITILSYDPAQVLARGWPRLHETIKTVEEVLAPAKRRVLDLRFLLRHQILALASTGFLEGTWIVPVATVERLRHWSGAASPRMQHLAQRALANINLFQYAYPSKLVVALQHLPLEWGPTKAMWTASIRIGTSILCTRARIDSYSKEIWQGGNISLAIKDETPLVLPLWVSALQSPYQAGDWLEVTVLGRGRQPLQARSQLEDGTLVLIAQGAPYLGQRVRIQVVHVLHSVTGFLIFATIPDR
jgi:uncharacterized protein YacL